MWKFSTIKCICVMLFVVNGLADNCEISWIKSGYEVIESKYVLQLSILNTTGDLYTYFPNTYYDVTIKSKLRNHTFTQFYFTIWNINKTMSYGSLELREKELSMFHNGPYCINRIIDGPVSLAKLKLIIGWKSPPVNSGCIEFRAAIKETEIRYHTTNLTVCQDPRVELDDPGEILRNCCACDEGKYELTFEGLWSRYTHPKNFPRREWLAVFPTIIGVSHKHDYEFWHAYANASNGLKKFAETGYTVDLELELKANKSSIGTLIKFRGSNFQNKTRKSFAEVRVDRYKHLVSLVARIEPSPDWFIGISSLELCQLDCTWIEQKTLNLYPYDAGVRNGVLYEDFGDITNPPDVIQHLNMTWPSPENNIESPFYDKANNTHDLRPLARIHLTRLRGSEKRCQTLETAECVTHWSSWSNCSVNCGNGIKQRIRSFIKPYNEDNCTASLIESTNCRMNFNCPREITKEDCVLTEWSEWSKCDRICGKEVKRRIRSFKTGNSMEECIQTFGEIVLEEKMDCGNPPCPHNEWECNDRLYNAWSDWTSCSLTDGIGHKIRYRTLKESVFKSDQGNNSDFGNSMCFYDSFICNGSDELKAEDSLLLMNRKEILNQNTELNGDTYSKLERPGICFENVDKAECQDRSEDSLRYYYDQEQDKCKVFRYYGCGGNSNNFKDEKKCNETCLTYVSGKKIDCLVSTWTDWTPCRSCNDIRMREKTILIEPRNGGRACPSYSSRVRREECKKVKKNCNYV